VRVRVHDVARRDVCRWIARCHGLAGAIDAGLLGRHQQKYYYSVPKVKNTFLTTIFARVHGSRAF
jgi:hypothetical protein